MDNHPAHVACIVGGGIAGSEAAASLAERKIHSVVIEMEALPYGKIEIPPTQQGRRIVCTIAPK